MRATQISVLNSEIERIAGANPVFILGDFNSSFLQREGQLTDGTNYAKFLSSKGYCDGLQNAPVKNVSTSTIDKCIDHVVYHPSTATPVEAVYIKRETFSNSNANKGYALKKYCDSHKISLNDVMAFGDTTNDNEMLEAAGIGVCLKNGTKDAMSVSEYITDKRCEESGFADFVNKFFYKEK